MKSRELQTLWSDWLGTSERLLRSLHEQTAAVTLRDIDRVQRIQPELEELMNRMKQIDDAALTCAKRLAEDLGSEPNLRGLVAVLEKSEAQQVQSIANKVTSAAQNVSAVVNKNRKLIDNEMHYINGTLTLIAKASVPRRGPYRGTASTRAAVLVDAAA